MPEATVDPPTTFRLEHPQPGVVVLTLDRPPGLSCGELGTSWLLTRVLGYGWAAELAFTGRIVEAPEAARIGLVDRVVPSDDLFAEADALATAIARHSPAAVRRTKKALQRNLEIPSYAAATDG